MDEKIELLLYGQQYKKFQETFYGDLMVQYHLNVIDIRVLLFFYEHKKWDTAKDIVQKHFLTKSYVSKAVDKLIEKGYLERRYYKEDRRYIHLVVQEKAVPVIKLIQEKFLHKRRWRKATISPFGLWMRGVTDCRKFTQKRG